MKITPDVFNKNNIMTRNIEWEGKIYNQLGSAIKKNYTNIKSIILARNLLFKPLPLKIYRREIASVDISVCNPRTSIKIDQLNMPGMSIITQNSNRGVNTSIDLNYENNTCQHPSLTITDPTYCNQFSAAKNARRRVRTSGIMKPEYNSSNAQYLNTRNLTFKQNEYFHIRKGNALAEPGTLAASQNIYSSNSGVTSCKKYFMSNTYFFYNWINSSDIRITIPTGYYDIDDLNNLLHYIMFSNKHYLIVTATSAKIYFLNFVYNVNINRVQLQVTTSNDTLFPNTIYSYPNDAIWTLPTSPNYFNPNIIIEDSIICNTIGFTNGTYPVSTVGSSTNFIIDGSYVPSIQPNNYVPIYYKPNNSKFGVQGAVTSSDLITRKKYITITNAANSFRTAFGNQTSDALAYGVPEYGYTLKDKVGFPLIKTPVISKYNGQINSCNNLRTRRNMLNG